jgi:hypothetical protein
MQEETDQISEHGDVQYEIDKYEILYGNFSNMNVFTSFKPSLTAS